MHRFWRHSIHAARATVSSTWSLFMKSHFLSPNQFCQLCRPHPAVTSASSSSLAAWVLRRVYRWIFTYVIPKRRPIHVQKNSNMALWFSPWRVCVCVCVCGNVSHTRVLVIRVTLNWSRANVMETKRSKPTASDIYQCAFHLAYLQYNLTSSSIDCHTVYSFIDNGLRIYLFGCSYPALQFPLHGLKAKPYFSAWKECLIRASLLASTRRCELEWSISG